MHTSWQLCTIQKKKIRKGVIIVNNDNNELSQLPRSEEMIVHAKYLHSKSSHCYVCAYQSEEM